MSGRLERKSIMPKEELDKAMACPYSGLHSLRRHPLHVALSPRFLGALRAGIVAHFNQQVAVFQPQIEGILAAYSNIFLKSPNGHFLNEEPHIHVDVVADFAVFRPEVGAVLSGVVVKKSPSHVSVLVHGALSVPCYRPRDDNGNDNDGGDDEEEEGRNEGAYLARELRAHGWCGARVEVKQLVRFTVLKTDMSNRRLPFILGDLCADSVAEGRVAEQGSWIFDKVDQVNLEAQNKKKKKEMVDGATDMTPSPDDAPANKVTKFSDSEDSGIDSAGKKKRKRKRDVEEEEQEEEEQEEAPTSHKKKRRKTIEPEEEERESQQTPEAVSAKKKKKKNSSKSQDEQEPEEGSKKKKKKKKSSKEGEQNGGSFLEDPEVKQEPVDSEETEATTPRSKKKKKQSQGEAEEPAELSSSKKKKKKKDKDNPDLSVEIKQEPVEPDEVEATPEKKKKAKKKAKK